MISIDDVLREIELQLAWRGPTDRPLGHVAIPRGMMEVLYDWAKERRDAELKEAAGQGDAG